MDAELKEMLERMQAESAAVRENLAAMWQETRTEFAAVRGGMAAMREETRTEFGAVREEMAAMRQENAKEHAETRNQLEEFRHETKIRFEFLGGGLELISESLSGVHERITRECDEIRGEMDDKITHTHSMIGSLNGELDGRVTALERDLADRK